MGECFSFFHCVASPFHSFVTTYRTCDAAHNRGKVEGGTTDGERATVMRGVLIIWS